MYNMGYTIYRIRKYTLGSNRIIVIKIVNQISNVFLYPNPKGKFNISIDLVDVKYFSLTLTNNLAEVIFNEKIKNNDAIYNKIIDLSDYPGGIYTLNIITSTQNLSQKIVLIKF